VVAVDRVAEVGDLVLGQVTDVGVRADAGVRQQLVRHRATDPVDVGQADLDALVEGDVDPGDTSHLADHPCRCL
jgi:hypothetical protein